MEKRKIKFVDVANYGFIAEPQYYFYGWSRSPKIFGRQSAVKALAKARKFLPRGYNFKVWDCRRPLKVQKLMLDSFRKKIKKLYQKLSPKGRQKILFKFGGKASKTVKRLDTHRNGGSFDLTVVDKFGKELNMGTDFDDLTKKAALDYYKKKKNLTDKELIALKNRRLLKGALTKAGFINYSPEWWHWSYKK
jgi:zinc D-Ala-D-Ala dipeptidase